MLGDLKRDLQARLSALLLARFSLEHVPVMEVPPRRELGDLASPVALHLARELKRRPREIAEALAGELELPALVERLSVEGPGYLNFFLARRAAAALLLDAAPIAPWAEHGEPAAPTPAQSAPAAPLKIIVEHTNINPNKAAHIGHLRNAVLGDILVRAYRALGHTTEVQNYIDDTGVQLADVVVAFRDLRGETATEVAAHPEPFDYLCWDVYSAVGRWYEEDPARQELRRATLHELESGQGERAELGRLIARRIVDRHLRTMARLGVGYDLLTRESEILRLDFFTTAFAQLRERGAIRLETAGKNHDCWVMPLSDSEEFQGLEDPDKVIVRSDGTVTYVGKDIAYQLWKFGLLGRDFEYRPFDGWVGLWETAGPGRDGHPAFGAGTHVVNVIDARQSYLQKIVRAGLEALGHEDEARRSVHFAYEMVSLSPQTARALGFLDEDAADQRLEMSGRKGIGVKADDLLDRLEAKSREEIGQRNRDLEGEELDRLARQIATAAVRYFMVRATTTRVIAFDLDQALSFEGDSGPYLQYSMVRAKNILRRLEENGIASRPDPELLRDADPRLWSDDLWDLVFTGAQVEQIVAKASETLELSLIARCAIDLAQKFHAVYHKHPILQEEDEALRAVRLTALHVFRQSLRAVCDLIGVEEPERM